jgi:hypothetical protein
MREDIKQIYLADRWTYEGVMGFEFDESDENRKYYVYEWHTSNGKIFYVGKGTSKLYNHILKEIEVCENNPRKYKGKNYKTLKDTYGIDYSILMPDLTESEAIIMENYFIIKYLSERQPLLNQIIPSVPEDSYNFWYDVHYKGELLDYFK